MATKTRTVKLSDIVVNDAMQSRVNLDTPTIEEYQAAYESGESLPALGVVDSAEGLLLYSGFHRYRALANLGRLRVSVEVVEGDRDDAILFAAGENHGHGRPRTNADKHRAVEMLLSHPKWGGKSDRFIAEHARVHHELVGRLRGESKPETTTGKDGKQRPSRKPQLAETPVDGTSSANTSEKQVGKSPPETDIPTVESLESLGNATPPAKLPPREPVEEQTAPPAVDNWGHALPAHTVDAFASVGELKTICALIGEVAKRLARWVSGPGGRHLSQGTIQQLEAAKGSAWAARPMYVCPYCHGDKSECQACKGDGWVTDRIWKAAPADKRGPF